MAANRYNTFWSERSVVLRAAVTWSVALIAVAVLVIPGAADLLQFDRQALAAGEWWRYFTGYVTHWNTEHLFWDVLMFVVLGCIVESQSRWRMVGLCLGAAVTISAFTGLARTDVTVCRGLSGIDTALFTYLAVTILVGAIAHRQWAQCLVAGVLCAGFGGKLIFETVTGSTLFVNSGRAGFVVLIEAHVLGALAGIAMAWIVWQANGSRPLVGRYRTAAKFQTGHRERWEVVCQPLVGDGGDRLLSANAVGLAPRVQRIPFAGLD